ncbi:uncharacterized protein E0L32_003980 [Thyridium curvatum]|uniref:Glucose/Sorbosone dehydrogenase domain-containing protein n=1 Tax=Thyridium curvatum TaxID=1093900 RepID=A0A507BH55_9PEZI|nr:uncharacterized protein E0L32_003980 [Thyridium curvatum]TPX16331.1 hypothetical protein E0L32_003980 [Thyridium curvatum]
MVRFRLFATCALVLATGSPVSSRATSRQAAPWKSTVIGSFAEPWALAFLPNNRILVTEKRGNLRIIDPATKATGQVTGVPTVRYGGQGGFADIALHPNYAENNLVYVSYAEPGTGNQGGAAVARAKLVLNANGGGALQDLKVIWRHTQMYSETGQYGQRLLFDADNSTLWISSGERQRFDPAQDMKSNLGKIIRLKDDGTVPEGNPFNTSGGATAQIWASGVRNPLGIDFDAEGRLWEIEMGPQGGDELNIIEKGANYGWPIVSEGRHYDGRTIPKHSARPEFAAPKVAWVPVISPAGMIIYKGDLFPNWKGNALITALGAQGIVRVEITGTTAREAQRIPMGRRMRCIRQTADGALWVLEDGAGGRLLKLTPS